VEKRQEERIRHIEVLPQRSAGKIAGQRSTDHQLNDGKQNRLQKQEKYSGCRHENGIGVG
jgi:hypothetical protein